MNELWITYQPHDSDMMFGGPSFNSNAFGGHALDVVVHEQIGVVPSFVSGSPIAPQSAGTIPAPASVVLFALALVVGARRKR